MLGGEHWKKVRTARIYDETYPNPYRLSKIPKYNRLINMKYDNPLAFYKLMLRIWEIRSWIHLIGNTFNDDYTNWNHHEHEPLMGISDVDTNPLFNWAINAKNIINNETDKVITSYFFNKDKYRFLYNITQGDYLGNLGGISLDTDKSKCIIFENETNNQDGLKGQVLYISFRETTGPLQMLHWPSQILAWERPCNYYNPNKIKSQIPYDISVGRGIWLAYTSGAHHKPNCSCMNCLLKMSKSVKENYYNNSIRKSLIEFFINNDKDKDFSKYKKIIISGMSLGGALAQCAAIDIRNIINIDIPIYIIIYASPRISDSSLLHYFNTNNVICLRIEANKYDDVVGFPALTAHIRYRHPGLSVRLNVNEDDIISNLKVPEALNTDTINISIKDNPIINRDLPYNLLGLNKNFHTRPNYMRYLYYLLKKDNPDKTIPPLFYKKKKT
jgi:hypothetical protein